MLINLEDICINLIFKYDKYDRTLYDPDNAIEEDRIFY